MKNISAIILGSIMLFLCTSCATVPMASEKQDALAKKFQASPDKGLIYLIRPSKTFGMGVTLPAVVDERTVGNLKSGSYALVEVAPGKHDIWVRGSFNNDTTLKIDIEAGKLYFVKIEIGMGPALPELNIEIVKEDEGRKLVNEYGLIETH
jgi:hypothetical protein